MTDFKVGQKVRCIKESNFSDCLPNKIGEVVTIKRVYLDNLVFEEYPNLMGCLPERFELVEELKAGDCVRLSDKGKEKYADSMSNPYGSFGVIVYTERKHIHFVDWDNGQYNSYEEGELELVKAVEYEDKWILNEGQEIPKDADTLEKNGSVVAYRLPKKPHVVRSENSIWLNRYGEVFSDFSKYANGRVKITSTWVDGKLTDVKAEIMEV